MVDANDRELEKERPVNRLRYEFWDGIKACNQFYKYAKERGVKIYYVYPSFAQSDYKENQNVINKHQLDLESNLEFGILGSAYDFVYPDSLFYNTRYHLNNEGKKVRTEQLIELIRKNNTLQ